jgi:hypothetical protein
MITIKEFHLSAKDSSYEFSKELDAYVFCQIMSLIGVDANLYNHPDTGLMTCVEVKHLQ